MGMTEEQKSLVEDNVRLVYWLMDKTVYGPQFKDEIESVLQYGLCMAAIRYDPSIINPNTGEPYKFSTLAITVMRNELYKMYRYWGCEKRGGDSTEHVPYETEYVDRLVELSVSPFDDLINNMESDRLRNEVYEPAIIDAYNSFNELQQKIILAHIQGVVNNIKVTQRDIAHNLGISQAVVSRTIRRFIKGVKESVMEQIA